MVIHKLSEVQSDPVREAGAEKVERRILLSPREGAPTFTMRRFEDAPGGCTMRHTHNYEHEIYVLSGKGHAWSQSGEVEIGPNDSILILPNEAHQILNSSAESLVFLCLIPNM
jgi:quercetin dioxygenase-like cupin family protein